jgi:NADPH-dependent glutamate synthase beta subunit-like oxidoreductase/2,4-dienoyl-CoA reductase-like NADH-dependent reductase (Old Yellow Enzyme family)
LAGQLGINIDAIEDVSILAKPVELSPPYKMVIPNSLAVHPMEGCDGDSHGRPGKLTIRRYERFAAGGAGLIWGEATAVVPEGRANPRQLWLNEDSKDAFAALTKQARQKAKESCGWHGLPAREDTARMAVSQIRPIFVAQLTHSGRYSKPTSTAQPIIAQRDPYRDPLVPQLIPDPNAKSKIPADLPIVTDDYLDRLQGYYVKAAKSAFEVGFDAVDIKSCHGYLINELFACRSRPGKYGGSFENRTRFFLEVIDKIRKELGPNVPIFTRLGVYDAIPYPYGWAVDKNDYTKPDLTEPKKLIALLQQLGVKLINITAANPYYNPHIGRPFNEPIVGGYPEPEHPLAGVARLVNLVGEIQKQFPDIAIVGTGYSWLRNLFPNVAAANKANRLVTLAGVGRMAFAYPDFAKDIITKGRLDPQKVCVACSACTQIMRDGGMTGCVVRDNKAYGPIFKRGRMSDRDNLLRLASICRNCQEATCRLACPAGVDIPKFISSFLDGNDRAAYEVLREQNIFPEVCAWLCPVEQQCEGNCLQAFIGDGPLPIADIQRHLAHQANKNGWSKLRIPEKASGKSVAIIGAGPAGLACAATLLEAGHTVTIFDKNSEFGGIIEAVIPPDRQSDSLKNEIAAIFSNVPKDRMILQLGKELNANFNLDAIIEDQFHAVFIGMGLPESVSTESKKDRIEGVWNVMDFLLAAKQSGKPDLKDKSVAVIGGGNTAMDAAVTAKQLGAKDVYIIYRRSFAQMPCWQAERERAINEGVHFLILTDVLKLNSHDGKLTSITACPTRLGEPDKTGRRKPELIKSSGYELPMDVVVEAIGQKVPDNIHEILPGVEFKDGLIKTKPNSLATSRPGVFAGGDLVRGPSTVVTAVADGMEAAKEIDRYLNK